jgi:hypothetical protein
MKRILCTLTLTALAYCISANAFVPDPVNPKQPANCKLHKLYCRILKLQPKADPKWAMALSNAVLKYAKQHKMDPWLSIAIAMQESSLKPQPRGIKVYVFDNVCDKNNKCKIVPKVTRGYPDLSPFQLHVNTIKQHNLDPLRLRNDVDYATKWHFEILKVKLKECRSLKNEAWSCYHSRTPWLREHYVKAVSKYYHGNESIRNEPAKVKATASKKKQSSSDIVNKIHGLTKKINSLADLFLKNVKTTEKQKNSKP